MKKVVFYKEIFLFIVRSFIEETDDDEESQLKAKVKKWSMKKVEQENEMERSFL